MPEENKSRIKERHYASVPDLQPPEDRALKCLDPWGVIGSLVGIGRSYGTH